MERNNRCLTWEEIYKQIYKLIDKVDELEGEKYKVWGIPRGGQIVAGMLGLFTDKLEIVDPLFPYKADIIVDDLYDSGTTYEKWW